MTEQRYPSGWWILPGALFGLVFWSVVAYGVTTVLRGDNDAETYQTEH